MRISVSLAVLLVLAGCGESPETAETAEDQSQTDTISDAGGGNAEGQGENPFAASENTGQQMVSACPDEAGLSCAGGLQIRAMDATLSNDRNSYVVRGSLQFRNTQNEPVEFAFLSENPNLRLDNGAGFQGGANYVFPGRDICSTNDTVDECHARHPDRFALLEAGDSPVNVNFVYQTNRVEPSLLTSMPDVETGTMNFSLVTVDASGAKRRRDISINSVPVTARVGS